MQVVIKDAEPKEAEPEKGELEDDTKGQERQGFE